MQAWLPEFNPQNAHKKLGLRMRACNLQSGEIETGNLLRLTGQPAWPSWKFSDLWESLYYIKLNKESPRWIMCREMVLEVDLWSSYTHAPHIHMHTYTPYLSTQKYVKGAKIKNNNKEDSKTMSCLSSLTNKVIINKHDFMALKNVRQRDTSQVFGIVGTMLWKVKCLAIFCSLCGKSDSLRLNV